MKKVKITVMVPVDIEVDARALDPLLYDLWTEVRNSGVQCWGGDYSYRIRTEAIRLKDIKQGFAAGRVK